MVRKRIIQDLEKAAKKLGLKVDKISVDHPPDLKFGDYTTNLALQQPKQTRGRVWQSSIQIAKKIVETLGKPNYLEKIEVAAPGFINFFLSKSFLTSQIGQILENQEKFFQTNLGKGKKARIEFVSANPTGPLHIGNARGGPIGDVIANVLESVKFKVIREYIHNDIGGQVEKFGQSLWSKIIDEKPSQLEYQGLYISELAEKLKKAKSSQEATKKAVEIMFSEIISDCAAIGIKFDKIYPESQFVTSGKTKKVIEKLNKNGFVKEKGDAKWFGPSDQFLKDRECVLVKSDGKFTYFANDITYHAEKFTSGVDLIIDIFGSNHHGHVPRLQAAMRALGFDVSKLKFILYQFVRVKRGAEIVRMSKRAGNFVEAREVLDEVGKDAFRFFMLMTDRSTHMDFDLELAKKKSADNPVYYVQYANARAGSILRRANSKWRQSLSPSERKIQNPKFNLLNHPAEIALIKQLMKLPEIIYDISQNFAVYRLANFSIETANIFHKFYEQCKVISKDYDLSKARLSLVMAAKITIAATLKLMGISAPEKM